MHYMTRSLALLAILGGCTPAIESVPGTVQLQAGGQYLATYGIARSVIKITLAKVAAPPAQNAQSSDSPGKTASTTVNVYYQKPGSAPGNEKVSPNSSNVASITPTTRSAADPTVETPTRANPASAPSFGCDALQKDYDSARGTYLLLFSQAQSLKIRIQARASAATDTTAIADAKFVMDQISAYLNLGDLVAQWRDAAAKLQIYASNLENMRAYCPTGSVSVTIDEATESDTKNTISLFLKKDAFSDDTVTYNASGGYITSLQSNSIDRTGDIIGDIAQTVAAFSVSPTSAAFNTIHVAGVGLAQGPADIAEHWLQELADDAKQLSNIKTSAELRQTVEGLSADIDFIGAPPPADTNLPLPMEYDFHPSDLDNPAMTALFS